MNKPHDVQHLIDDAFDWRNPDYTLKPLVTHDGAPVVSEGELTIIAGAKKTYKSHIAYSIALAAMGAPCVGFESAVSSSAQVALFDTEQPSSRLSHGIRKMSTHLGVKNIDAYLNVRHWKGEAPAMMRECLPGFIAKYMPKIVILDGIADFVDDVNSIVESRQVVELLQSCAEEYNCAIVAIIHYNPYSQKERGHLGTILANKTDGYISLSRKAGGGVLVAANDCSRGEPFKPFTINYDPVADWIIMSATSATKTTTPVCTEKLIRSIPSILMTATNGALRRNEIVSALTNLYKIDPKNATKIDRALKCAKERGLITQSKPRGLYKLM